MISICGNKHLNKKLIVLLISKVLKYKSLFRSWGLRAKIYHIGSIIRYCNSLNLSKKIKNPIPMSWHIHKNNSVEFNECSNWIRSDNVCLRYNYFSAAAAVSTVLLWEASHSHSLGSRWKKCLPYRPNKERLWEKLYSLYNLAPMIWYAHKNHPGTSYSFCDSFPAVLYTLPLIVSSRSSPKHLVLSRVPC